MHPPAGDDVETWPTGRLLSAAARLVEHDWNAHLAAWDLNHAGLAALHVLSSGPLTQREIATRVQVEDQTMSRTLDRLERCGYVQRRRDAEDRRRVVVTLTASGRRTCLRASDVSVAEGFFADTVEDVEVLRRALAGIVRTRSQQRWPNAGHLGPPDPEKAAAEETDPGHHDTGHHDTRHRDTGHHDTGHHDTGHRDAG